MIIGEICLCHTSFDLHSPCVPHPHLVQELSPALSFRRLDPKGRLGAFETKGDELQEAVCIRQP